MAGNGEILDRLNAEALNGGNPDVLDELVADDFVEHNPLPGSTGDREGFKDMIRAIHAAFPDFHTDVQDQIVAGDRVVERWTADGRIVEHWTQMDTLSMLQQLGALPSQAPA